MRSTMLKIKEDRDVARRIKGGVAASENSRESPRQGDIQGGLYASSLMGTQQKRPKYLRAASQNLDAEIAHAAKTARELGNEHDRANRELKAKLKEVTTAARAVSNQKSNVNRMREKVKRALRDKLDAEDALQAKVDEPPNWAALEMGTW